MKKRFIAIIALIVVVLLLGVLSWSGYLMFQGFIPSFTLDPGGTDSDSVEQDDVAPPRLVIESITGKMNKLVVHIKNIGDQDATSVVWTVSVKGGILKRINSRYTGTLNLMVGQSSATVMTERIPLGFGRLQITVTVESAEGVVVTESAQGFKLWFFVVAVRM